MRTFVARSIISDMNNFWFFFSRVILVVFTPLRLFVPVFEHIFLCVTVSSTIDIGRFTHHSAIASCLPFSKIPPMITSTIRILSFQIHCHLIVFNTWRQYLMSAFFFHFSFLSCNTTHCQIWEGSHDAIHLRSILPGLSCISKSITVFYL